MKHLYKLKFLLPVLMLFAISAKAQLPACSTYVFTTSSETFTYLSGGTSASSILCDDCIQTNIPMNFTFPFCGNNYNTVSVGSNGYLSLSNSANVWLGVSTSAITSTQPVLFGMWGDEWGSAGAASYLTTGSAPNRVFTFEWRNWRPYANQGSAEYSMQMRLYETSGRIQFLYKREGTTTRTSTYGIGIAWSAADYQSLQTNTATPAISNTSLFTYSGYPPNNQVYQWDPPTPCTKASALTMGNYNSQAASFSWTGVPGSLDYQYAVDTRADLSPNLTTTITNTTVTSGTAIGLTPNTRYYIHVRTRCSLTSISQWDTLSFVTLPQCSRPDTLIVGYVDSNSVNFQWSPVITALSYDYIFSSTKIVPTKAMATNISSPVVAKASLTEGTWYYVYYRSLCTNADSSGWMLDSIYTPVPCRAPQLSMNMLVSNNAIVTWSPVNTAYQYEYFVGTSATEPTLGTPHKFTSLQLPYLVPKSTYDLFVRCNCSDNGIKTNSKWALLEFATPPPTAINSIYMNAVNLSVYPNPAHDVLYVELSGKYSSKASIYITDVAGRVIQTVDVSADKFSVDVSRLAKGLYFLKFMDGEHTKTTRFNKL